LLILNIGPVIDGAANSNYNLGVTFSGFNHYAASKPRPNNNYFLFIHINSKLILITIDALGVSIPTSQSTNFSPYFGTSKIRAEMELIEYVNTTTNQLTYKIALPYSDGSGNQCLYVTDLDYTNGTIIVGSERNYTYPTNIEIKGLEFSSNGNYLYVTHTGGSFIDYFDVTLPALTPQSLGVPNALDFQYSQIELGADGKLYFVGAHPMINFLPIRLATLTNPNTPNPSFWNNNALSINYVSNTGVFSNSFNKSFILPDQIDGMDYYAHHTADLQCCLDNTSFNVSAVNNSHEYTGTQTWNYGTSTANNPWSSTTPILVKDKLIIKTGANITINNMRFEFAPKAQLIIENGAQLTINGTTLTAYNLCDQASMWHGVEVWGTGTGTFQSQVSGKFVANNSLIEHAIVATANAKHNVDNLGNPYENSFDLTKVGGIIKSNTTVFHNNVKDVQFHDFISMIGTLTINDQSSFIKCHFLTDDNLNNPNRLPFAHADLRRVRGINFKGCVFENTATSKYAVADRGYGVYSIESLFSVTNLCTSNMPFPITCPIANTVKSEFNNLYYAVYGLGLGTATRTARITNSILNNNFRGILLRNMSLAQVTGNVINVGNNIAPNAPSYGLYLLDCDKYKVEENNFSTISGYYGAYINNSGIYNNEIYHNTFANFRVATQAANKNGSIAADGVIRGLEFRCNKYYNTDDFDILVSSGVIKLDQGLCIANKPQSPANNQFSYFASQGDYWLNNNVLVSSQYHYSPNGAKLPPRTALGYINNNNTFDQPCSSLPNFDSTQSCPVRVGNSLIVLGQLKAANQFVINNLTAQIDGGNTANLINTIATEPAWKVRNDLMAASPNLSDAVLIALLNSNMPDWVHQQVLSANAPLSDNVFLAAVNRTPAVPENIIRDIAIASSPLHTTEQLALINHTPKYADWLLTAVMEQNSPLKDEVLTALINKTPSISHSAIRNILLKNTPLSSEVNDAMNNHLPNYPNWVINAVNNSNFVTGVAIEEPQSSSAVSELTAEINYYEAENERYTNDILRIYLFDDNDAGDGVADVIAYIDSTNCTSGQCLLTCAYIDNADYTAAQQTVNGLSNNIANSDFCNLYNSIIQYEQLPNTEMELLTNNSLLTPVQNVAQATTQNAEVGVAQAILELVNTQGFQETFEYVTVNNNNQRLAVVNENNAKAVSNIKIYPNPAKDQFTLTHNLELANGVITLSVFDLMGRKLITETINDVKANISTQKLTSGVYFYTITQNNSTIQSDKLMIE
jgi:hypothetical protein